MSSAIQFEESAHTYHVGGIRRPSVTEIIQSAGLIDDRYFTEESRNRGKYVHAATHYLDENDLALGEVPEKWLGYINAWVRFKEEARFTPELIEHRVYHERYGYCGTLDRMGHFDGGMKAVIDLKSGVAERWHGCQIAGYTHALDRDNPDQYRKITVLLRADGTFRINEYDAVQYRDHWSTFLCALGIHNFKTEGKNVRNSNAA